MEEALEEERDVISNNTRDPAIPFGKAGDELGLLLEILKLVENVDFLIFDIRVPS
ncbi:hypothetical protein MGYG_08290 [Nannizzia gypsea CBS 118893]|uniref:Uncharacterized protein n=1 Tax=Arthroderma gypseum (strain ATCC MYA-4604 / CBS 118893) TaxID=535722 RepID=E4V696_ARTGP|nr:hypothetical protein MGYG_08290 [Nannizzia gypsea CBS 118893]EFR05279.1 hypothetical protein MGYG_08290 [Nannizzia gypsea CBS 118893]